MTQSHTPTPWYVSPVVSHDGDYAIADENGALIATILADQTFVDNQCCARDNAAYIVKAVNCHDELVIALRSLVAASGQPSPMGSIYDLCRALPYAREVLAKAGVS